MRYAEITHLARKFFALAVPAPRAAGTSPTGIFTDVFFRDSAAATLFIEALPAEMKTREEPGSITIYGATTTIIIECIKVPVPSHDGFQSVMFG